VAVLVFVLPLSAGDLASFARTEAEPASLELSQGWKLASERDLPGPIDGAALSAAGYDDTGWHAVRHMPSTVLQTLQDDNVYPDVYLGTNLRDRVPADLYRQQWWYRTTFTAPAGHSTYTLQFPGINYRAEIWLNGHMLADSRRIVGMYSAHELNATRAIRPGQPNTLAVRVTPEQALQDRDGVELADSWWDWINWRGIGYPPTGKDVAAGTSFVADRNAGIWKPVYLRVSGAVTLGTAAVTTELPLPRTDSARLTIYADARNDSARTIRGVVRARISRASKPGVEVEQPVTLSPGEDLQVQFDAEDFPALTLSDPDLWWPYTLGRPDLYDLTLEFRQYDRVVDVSHQRFGIRSVQQFRDGDERFPELGRGGSFYLKVNGRDFRVRGATYTPDLLFKFDPDRETAILGYVRDLGLNMIRLEGKFPGEHLLQTADDLGIPVMYGWMCCNQWEKWDQWDDEDRRVARDSLRSQIDALKPHASAFVWANGSDGRPPEEVLTQYHAILSEAHWPNATVDTVSSVNLGDDGEPMWDGIQMAGPYSWRPPSYWFSGRYAATRGASAEQGDNEHIPPFASLKQFIPADKLWPVNDTWYFHAGSDNHNERLDSIRTAVGRRYGVPRSAQEFARKAQLAHYESTRAQFEAFAAGGWDTHKMTIYWMLNNHWPSFFGNLFDYYLRPGGAYYGAKKGLQPLSVVFDSYATGDRAQARITVVNQSPHDQRDLRARVRVYDLNGNLRDDRVARGIVVGANGALQVMTLPREALDSRVFFVRCELTDAAGAVIADNVYWQSQRNDDVGDTLNDTAFQLKQLSWADLTPLSSMPRAPLEVTARRTGAEGGRAVVMRLTNRTRRISFFQRAEVLSTRDGDEILPIEYSDNYVTVFPGESVTLRATLPTADTEANWVRVEGYNTDSMVVPVISTFR
jgi:exo-1,4-beta-D-glucosaminidase